MHREFHIYTSEEGQAYTLRQEGLDESQRFTSLAEATRHLREQIGETEAYVVIHDDESSDKSGPNRIPLHIDV